MNLCRTAWVWPTDSAASGPELARSRHSYADNYSIDVKFGVIVDVEASRSIRQAHVGGTAGRLSDCWRGRPLCGVACVLVTSPQRVMSRNTPGGPSSCVSGRAARTLSAGHPA